MENEFVNISFHERCVKKTSVRACPVPFCGKPFTHRRRVPDPEHKPSSWFQIVDFDDNGSLSKDEVIQILRAQLPIDERKLGDLLEVHWSRWDVDGNGSVDMMEMIHPHNGLLAFVKRNREKLIKARKGAPPDLMTDPESWFDYWDEDNSLSLDLDEVVRAIIKTFELSADESASGRLHRVITAIWPVFDHDGSGAIDKEEFMLPKIGLGAALIASLAQQKQQSSRSLLLPQQ